MGKELDKTVKYAIPFLTTTSMLKHVWHAVSWKDLYPIPVSLVKPKFMSQEVPAWSFAQVAVVFLHQLNPM